MVLKNHSCIIDVKFFLSKILVLRWEYTLEYYNLQCLLQLGCLLSTNWCLTKTFSDYTSCVDIWIEHFWFGYRCSDVPVNVTNIFVKMYFFIVGIHIQREYTLMSSFVTPAVQCAAVNTNHFDINEPVQVPIFFITKFRTTVIVKPTTNGYFTVSYICPLAIRPLFSELDSFRFCNVTALINKHKTKIFFIIWH